MVVLHINYVLYYNHYSVFTSRTPAPGVRRFTVLLDPSLVIIKIYSVFMIFFSGSRETDIQRKHLQYTSNKVTPQNNNLYPGGHEIYNFDCYSVCLTCAQKQTQRIRFFNDLHKFYTYLPGQGSCNLQFYVFSYMCYIPIW